MLTEKQTDHLKEIEEYYKPKMKEDLPDFEVLGWENREAHLRRFRMLEENTDLQGRTVLDIGCGLGTFYEFLESRGLSTDYTGVDILAEMISMAKARHKNARFSCMDIFEESTGFDKRFNVVFASGIFNLNLGNNTEFMQKAIKRFFELSDEIIAFNLLHEDSEDREERYFYTNPAEINRLLEPYRENFRDVEFYHSYQKNDFTVIIRK